MKIAFVTTYNAKNVSNWSGLGYYISKSLEDGGNNMEYIGILNKLTTNFNLLQKAYYTKIIRKKFPLERTISFAKRYSDKVAQRISGKDFNCIFSPGSLAIAYLKTSAPKVMYTDATFASMLDYYEPSSNLPPEIIRQGHELEKQALDSCSLSIFSSDWAAQSAIQYYGADPLKIKVVPFGANFDMKYAEEDITDFIYNRDKQTLKLLFNGVDWKRKGGDLVLRTAKELIKRGLKVEVHLVGMPVLPISDVPDFIIHHGYLKKSVPQEKEILENLYKTCHFLFLPSRAEAFGCVFCEASSFGMPSILSKTGGVMSAITNGKNGYALEQSAGVDEYSDLISSLFLDNQKYTNLSLSSYQEYKNKLNWKTAGESLTKLIEQL